MTHPTHAAYRAIPSANVTVGGWLEHQARATLEGYVGAMPALSVEVGGDVFAAGRLGPDSDAEGTNVAGIDWWNGESEGNWLLAWVTNALLLHDAPAIEAVESYLKRILDAQDSNGHIGMFTPGARSARPYIGGELWAQSRVLGALQSWAEYMGDTEVDSAISRALAYSAQRFAGAVESGDALAPDTGDSCGRGHDLMIVEVLTEHARRTSDDSLATFAEAMYRSYSGADVEWQDADGQLDRLMSDAPVIGHGAHTAEHLRIPLLIAELNGDEQLVAAFANGYRKVTDALGVGGAMKSDETISTPGGQPVPVPESGYEYCAITELAISLLEAARITGDFEYLDRVERLFLNTAQAGIAKDGRSAAYLVAENQAAATHAMGTRWDYSPTHDDVAVCCVPNAGRLLPVVAKRMVMVTDAGISVQLYGPMEATVQREHSSVRVRQETNFPFDEQITVRLESEPQRFEVELRIPQWCSDPSVNIAGATDVTEEWLDDRVRIAAVWGLESEIRLLLPQNVRTLPTVDGRTAFAVGPLVYSIPIESTPVPHRQYETAGFADIDLIPTSPALMYPPVLLQNSVSQVRTSLVQSTRPDPWSESSFELTVPGINPNPIASALDGGGIVDLRLVPMGATTLRWTALTTSAR